MRALNLQTNLRQRQLRRWHGMTGAIALLAVAVLGFSYGVWRDAVHAREEAEGLRLAVERTAAEVADLERVRAANHVDDELVAWLRDVVPTLGLPTGMSPAEALYELEKLIPNDVYLITYEQDADGAIEFVATTENRNELAETLARLQRSSVFPKVQIINQRESVPGRFEAHVKLDTRGM